MMPAVKDERVIQFPCHCGYVFRVDNDQAGAAVQCPKCRLLNDVPAHSDLDAIAEDGTYKLDADLEPANPEALADLLYVYQRGVRDAEGNEIDLKLRPSDLDVIGGEPIPLVPQEQRKTHSPRYDPETGELVTPLDVKQTDSQQVDPASIPMARAAINYASGMTARRMSFIGAFVQMFMPVNLAVMFAVLIMHLVVLPLYFITAMGIFFFIVALVVMDCVIPSHYANIIEEVGPFESDELPRPLRNLGWYEDVWAPFVAFFGSMVICYGPSFVVNAMAEQGTLPPIPALVLWVALAAVGTFFFPAVLLTLATSGTSLNLRPDRVMGVIVGCGPSYFFAVVLWVISAGIYMWGWTGTRVAIVIMFHPRIVPWLLTSWPVVLSMLTAGVFLMHYYCFCMGLLYRAHYHKFPWVLQRHTPTRRLHDGIPPQPPRRIRPIPQTRTDRP
jgi:hypothetical protein